MTDLNRVNFMSKERFTNLNYTNDDELYIVEASIPNDEDLIHKTGDETIAGTKTFSTTPNVGTLNVSNNSPYAASTAFVKTAISNEDALVVHLGGDETIDGIKTFSSEIHITSTPSASNETSNNYLVPNISWVNNPNLSTNVVHRSGNEDISGIKTFVNDTGASLVRIKGSSLNSSYLYLINDNIDSTENPSTTCTSYVIQGSSDSKDMAYIRFAYETDGSSSLSLNAKTYNNGTPINGSIGVSVDRSNNVTTYAPTPSTNDNSTKIATTAYVQSNKLTATIWD